MKIKIVFLLSIYLVFLCSCTSKDTIANTDKMPGIDIPIKEYNTKIILTLWPGTPLSYKVGDLVTFGLNNYFDKPIVFSNDFGVKIFIKHDKTWELIKDCTETSGSGYTMQPNKIAPVGEVVDVVPVLPDLTTKTIVRVVVVGHVENKPSEQVASYIDVTFGP